MKLKIMILSMLILGAVTSHAVTTADCPQSLKIQISEFQVIKTSEQIVKELVDGGYGSDPREMDAVTTTLFNVLTQKKIERSWKLIKSGNGKCTYQNAQAIEKADVYSSNGKNIFMAQFSMGPRGTLLRVYAQIASLQPQGIALDLKSAGLALAIPRSNYETYSAGGPLIFFGKALRFNISTNVF